MNMNISNRKAETPVPVSDFLSDSIIKEMYGDKELRWAQVAARNMLTHAIANGIMRNLIWMPTGSGKTLTVACTLDQNQALLDVLNVVDRKLRVLFMAHINHLLTQAERTFVADSNVELRTTTPFSEIPQEDIDWADIIVIDEAHHEAMMSVQLQLDKVQDKPVVGLTATPDRPDGFVIKFENIIQPCTREQAVAEGWLAETSIWSIVDLSGKNKTNLIKLTIDNYHDIMGKTIIFTKTKAEAKQVHEYLIKKGLKSVVLDKQSKTQITQILDDFGAGKYQFVVNCSKIGEGIDVPGITSIIIGKNLGSYTQLNQYIGRTARPDSDSQVFEFINPLSGRNLDTTVVVGTPKQHILCAPNGIGGFNERYFNYVAVQKAGIESVGAGRRRRAGQQQ